MANSFEGIRAKLMPAAIILASMIVVVAFLPGSPDQGNSFSGEIMDAQCAQAGSHDAMMAEHTFTTTLQCALFCARAQQPGGKFVLYDETRNRVYKLDNQEKAELYASEKVTISGSYDAASKTIQIADIEARP